MTSTRHGQRKALPQSASLDGLEELRRAFHDRLQSERVRFVTLSAALARAEENPARIFEDLQFRAHKICGGAAIFELADVAAAARALEEAALSAAMSDANNTDVAVWSALVALVHLMGSLERGYDPAHATPRSARNSSKILAV